MKLDGRSTNVQGVDATEEETIIGNGSRQITDRPAKEINSCIYRVIQIFPLCDQAGVINLEKD